MKSPVGSDFVEALNVVDFSRKVPYTASTVAPEFICFLSGTSSIVVPLARVDPQPMPLVVFAVAGPASSNSGLTAETGRIKTTSEDVRKGLTAMAIGNAWFETGLQLDGAAEIITPS